MDRIKLIGVVGPTATGKTKYSIELAERFNGEIVSCDSMQIYKEVSIGTAKPTAEEMRGIPHHMLDIVGIEEKFSVAQYVSMAHRCIRDIADRGKTPIVVGGTGLYFNSLIDNIDFSDTTEDEELRRQLKEKADREGGEALLQMLSQFDPQTAQRLHPNNVGRIIRAIEIYKTTGVTMSESLERSRLQPSPYEPTIYGLTCEDREILYSRIEKRVDIMMEQGLEDEARLVMRSAPNSTCAQAIGYKEFLPYFNGECALDDAVAAIKLNTRHYAKRQLSWFRRDKRIEWIYIDKKAVDNDEE